MHRNKFNSPEWYNENKLRSVIYSRDIDNPKKAIMNIFHITEQPAYRRLNFGKMDHEETIILARALKLTPREYCECFLNGVFEELKSDE